MSTTLEAIQDLSNLLNSKFSTTFKINSKESDIQFRLPTPLILDQKFNYELGLSWFSVYNFIYNITSGDIGIESNNIFMVDKIPLQIPAGAYEIKKLSEVMNKLISKKLKKPSRS